ncbi:hypothetical protein FRC11_013011 [Ceratobasidium sp. 423]|nr:hypothetical protein FRC11_013011 [Ceratobasidium sp. 423]
MEELMTSCELLDSALERYYNACVALEQETYHNFAQTDLHGTFLKDLADKLNDSASHKKKIRRCEMALRRVRNHSPTVVPINALPPEVLTRVFGMLHSCCFKSRKSPEIIVPMYPDTLAQVCSRWRRVAIGSCSLWSHIDLSPLSDKNLSQRLLSRGKVFASRSEKQLLDIHIGGTGGEGNSDNLAKFCTTISFRARSLEVFSPDVSAGHFKVIYNPIFNACFTHCVPGTLDHLAIRGERSKYSSIWPSGADGCLECFTTRTGAGRIRLDEILLGVQVLHLGINCIPPTSRAYQGLVELRLMGSEMRLTETRFLGILAASPKLRILYLDVDIWDASQSPPRVQLNELEVLFLSWVEDKSNLLRLLCPGAQPLKLILEGRNRLSMSRSTATEFIKLFERSIVTELYVHQVVGTPGCGEVLFNPFQLLELTPHLRTLALSGIGIEQPPRRLVNKPSVSSSVDSLPRLETLHLVAAPIYWASCLNLFRIHCIQRVTFWDCTVYAETTNSCIKDQELIRSILADICPTVQILDGSMLKLAGVRDEN